MADKKMQYKNQVNKVVDQVTANTDGVFGLFTTIVKEAEALANTGLNEIDNVLKIGQRYGREIVGSASKTTQQALKASKSGFNGTLGLAKANSGNAE